MAITFDESNDYYQIADSASLNLPDGDWSIGIWVYVTDNTGSAAQYLISNNNYGYTNSINLYLNENSAGYADKWEVNVRSTNDQNRIIRESGTTGDNSTWTLVCVTYDDSTPDLRIWTTTFGGTPSYVSETGSNFDVVDGLAWNIGRRYDGNVDRYFGGVAAEFFVLTDHCLSSEEISALARGVNILALGHVPAVYLPMWTAESTLKDLTGNNNATRYDSPTTAEHPPVTLTGGTGIVADIEQPIQGGGRKLRRTLRIGLQTGIRVGT